MTPRTDPLFTPYSIGPVTLRKRIISTSHESSYTDDGMPGDRYRRCHVETARVRLGRTMIGGSAIVSRDSPAAFGYIDLSTDKAVPWLQKLTGGGPDTEVCPGSEHVLDVWDVMTSPVTAGPARPHVR